MTNFIGCKTCGSIFVQSANGIDCYNCINSANRLVNKERDTLLEKSLQLLRELDEDLDCEYRRNNALTLYKDSETHLQIKEILKEQS